MYKLIINHLLLLSHSRGVGYSLWWTLRRCSARKGYLFGLQVCERSPFSVKDIWKGAWMIDWWLDDFFILKRSENFSRTFHFGAKGFTISYILFFGVWLFLNAIESVVLSLAFSDWFWLMTNCTFFIPGN